MADQPPESLRKPLADLTDRYRELVAAPELARIEASLRALEAAIRFGDDCRPSILHEQLVIAKEWGEEDRRTTGEEPPRLLLLPLGYSPDALLLAVAFHAPASVVLLVSTSLNSASYLPELEALWDAERDLLESRRFGELARKEVRDDPADVFSTIRDVIPDHPGLRKDQIVLDLTGGKKSITAGAFLAAVHLGIVVSYVDFRDYDPVLRRPRVGSIQPGRLPDPFRLFRLREEERLVAVFSSRRYEEAERLAAELEGAATDPQVEAILGRPDAEARRARFARCGIVARGYRLWGDGFYRDARETLKAVPDLPIAPTLEALGEVWPTRDTTHQAIVGALDESVIFARPIVVLAYFLDVLAWWDQTRVQHRPRDAYVRLYGTVESLFSFLVHAHVARHPQRLKATKPGAPAAVNGGLAGNDVTAEELRTVLETCYSSSNQARKLLRGKPLDLAHGKVALSAGAIPKAQARRLFDRSGGGAPYWGRFAELRHKAVHWLAPVPVELAVQLRSYLCTICLELVPPAVEDLIAAGEDRAELSPWLERLNAAAEGSVADQCQPLSYQELENRLLSHRSSDQRAAGRRGTR